MSTMLEKKNIYFGLILNFKKLRESKTKASLTGKKSIFFRIFDMVGFKVIQNSVYFQKECSILSLKDKMTKNEYGTNF